MDEAVTKGVKREESRYGGHPKKTKGLGRCAKAIGGEDGIALTVKSVQQGRVPAVSPFSTN